MHFSFCVFLFTLGGQYNEKFCVIWNTFCGAYNALLSSRDIMRTFQFSKTGILPFKSRPHFHFVLLPRHVVFGVATDLYATSVPFTNGILIT